MLKKIRHRSSKELVAFLTKKIENGGGEIPLNIFDSVMKIIFFGDHPRALPEKDGGVANKFRVSDKLIPWLEAMILSVNSPIKEEIEDIIEKIKNN